MGFWDIAKEIGGMAVSSASNRVNRLGEYREKYESYSDEDLKRAFHRKSGDERVVIIKLLKDRGYTASDLQ